MLFQGIRNWFSTPVWCLRTMCNSRAKEPKAFSYLYAYQAWTPLQRLTNTHKTKSFHMKKNRSARKHHISHLVVISVNWFVIAPTYFLWRRGFYSDFCSLKWYTHLMFFLVLFEFHLSMCIHSLNFQNSWFAGFCFNLKVLSQYYLTMSFLFLFLISGLPGAFFLHTIPWSACSYFLKALCLCSFPLYI